MKRLLMILLVMFSLYSSASAQSLSARISNPRVDGGNFKWEIDIMRTDDWGTNGGDQVLGNCDFYFTINSAAFTGANPTLSNINASISGSANYGLRTGRPTSSQCYVALDYDVYGGGSDWYPSQSWQTFCTVSLPIADFNQSSQLEWNVSSTGFSRGNAQPLTKTLTGSGDISLPVQMTNITAMASQDKGVILTWRTESEVDCAGFNVWRNQAEDGEYTKITTALIAGQGNTSAAHEYTFIDRNVENGVIYWYKIEEVSSDGASKFYDPVCVEGIAPIPTEFVLSQNYPNPFNPTTVINYRLPERSRVSLTVFNIRGNKIAELVKEEKQAGNYSVTWDGRDMHGNKVSSGLYFYKLEAGMHIYVRKMMFVE